MVSTWSTSTSRRSLVRRENSISSSETQSLPTSILASRVRCSLSLQPPRPPWKPPRPPWLPNRPPWFGWLRMP